MADEISSSLISVVKGNIDQSSIYINTSELKQWIKKRRIQNTDLVIQNKTGRKDICRACGPPISYNNTYRRFWDYFIILVAVYSTFIIPVKIAF
jgi:hypothetical protein